MERLQVGGITGLGDCGVCVNKVDLQRLSFLSITWEWMCSRPNKDLLGSHLSPCLQCPSPHSAWLNETLPTTMAETLYYLLKKRVFKIRKRKSFISKKLEIQNTHKLI